jgi:hypothetical protein
VVSGQEKPVAVVLVHALIVRLEGEIVCKAPAVRQPVFGKRHLRQEFVP